VNGMTVYISYVDAIPTSLSSSSTPRGVSPVSRPRELSGSEGGGLSNFHDFTDEEIEQIRQVALHSGGESQNNRIIILRFCKGP
jgi:hypothetical protein